MADQIQEVQQTTSQGGVPVRTTKRVTTSDNTEAVANRSNESTAVRVVYFIVGFIATILAARFVLSLLGANRANAFADLVYGISYPFVAPFFGLFGYEVAYGKSRFEIEALVAIAVYALVGYGIVQLIKIARKTN